jgi:hypothetical protein
VDCTRASSPARASKLRLAGCFWYENVVRVPTFYSLLLGISAKNVYNTSMRYASWKVGKSAQPSERGTSKYEVGGRLLCMKQYTLSDSLKSLWGMNLSGEEEGDMPVVNTTTQGRAGHRERLKAHFIAGLDEAHTDEALLELLLTYAIPQKDVAPLARRLLATFGSLSAVLSADLETLCRQEGIKEHSAVLLKLMDWIREHQNGVPGGQQARVQEVVRPTLFPDNILSPVHPRRTGAAQPRTQPRSGLFSNALLHETIDMLPRLPDTESLDEIKDFLKQHLPFSGQTTRERGAQYITQRMFPHGYADRALRTFTRKYAGKQELRDVCFYRFCKAEPLMYEVIEQLILPALGAGQLERSLLREYLA